ncbi:MAG: hypothetical protein ACJ790_13140 [Myxococcaceae bacterium]
MARKTKKKSARRSGSIRVRKTSAYVARAADRRDDEVAARITAMVEEGAAVRRDIEDRIEARLRGRRD